MANALLDPTNTHFILVCESTAPLFSFPFIYEYFTSEPKGFLSNWPNTGHHWSKKFLPLIPRSDWGKGDAWFALLRSQAQTVVGDTEYYAYFKAVKLSNGYDEQYYQTLLWKKDPGGLISHTPMNVRWTQGPHFSITGAHPVKYESWHTTPGLIASLTGPYCAPGDPKRWRCHLFARKFRPAALQALMQLLPLPKALAPGEVDAMVEQWWGPQNETVPEEGVPGEGRAAGSYLEEWRGEVEKSKKGKGREAGGRGEG